MEIGTLIEKTGGGMWISAEIFILTLLFFTAAWTSGCIRENVKDTRLDRYQNYTYRL